MTYSWRFRTVGSVVNPINRQCHRGPMIDVEVVMSKPFTIGTNFEFVRSHLIPVIVNSDFIPEATREITLRAMNSLLSPVFARLLPKKKDIQVLICNKRNCVDIERDLEPIAYRYTEALTYFPQTGSLQAQLLLLKSALFSESPIVRVAGRSALVLLASYLEMDLLNA